MDMMMLNEPEKWNMGGKGGELNLHVMRESKKKKILRIWYGVK
jgi:hypothetical protein